MSNNVEIFLYFILVAAAVLILCAVFFSGISLPRDIKLKRDKEITKASLEKVNYILDGKIYSIDFCYSIWLNSHRDSDRGYCVVSNRGEFCFISNDVSSYGSIFGNSIRIINVDNCRVNENYIVYADKETRKKLKKALSECEQNKKEELKYLESTRKEKILSELQK